MIYAVSNIHGCYSKFKELLGKISFSENDLMYVLGDIVDYGEESMELVCDLSVRTNIYPVMGEHDALAYEMLSKFDEMIKNGGTPDAEYIAKMQEWSKNGGDKTLLSFRSLTDDMKEGVLDYLCDMPSYEIAEVNSKKYLMVNAGIAGFEKGKEVEDYDEDAFYTENLDMDREYFKNTTIICGQKPLKEMDASPNKIVKKGKNIALDCRAAFDGKLACLCLDNGNEYYI